MDDDKAVYVKMRAGDKDALRTLVNRYHRGLFDYLFRLTDHRSLAEDLVQQTFIRILTYTGDAPTHLRGWLFTIARNLAYDHFRSAQFRYEQNADFIDDDGTSTSMPEFTPEQMTILGDQREAIASLLKRLPPEQREVIILRFYHDMSLSDIAEQTSTPVGTVKSRLFHALKKLKVYFVETSSLEIGQPDE